MAVLDCAVSLVEPATLGQEIAQLRPLKAEPAPGDLGMRAGPGLDPEVLGQALTEGAVKASVVRDDQIRRCDKTLNRFEVEHLAGDHVGGDTS
jgi:hypothetical protein